jgi:glucose-1-phosphate cytidylyltransferase
VKVVIFCGGLGVRMGDETKRTPKPMIQIGGKPILWHIMRYYAAWGHHEFILCVGYKAEVIKEYFLSYEGALFNDFVLQQNASGHTTIERLPNPLDSMRITFVDTGIDATIGERLKAIEPYLGDDPEFLATYGDGLTDAPLPEMIQTFRESRKTALCLAVHPQYNVHLVDTDPDGIVRAVEDLSESNVRINGGFFVFRREILDLIRPGDDLVVETFAELIKRGELLAMRYEGFFCAMDTIKDRQRLEALHQSGDAPWQKVGIDSGTGETLSTHAHAEPLVD